VDIRQIRPKFGLIAKGMRLAEWLRELLLEFLGECRVRLNEK
jgi:hypothetical protein